MRSLLVALLSFVALLLFAMLALIFHWVNIIKINSDEQLRQTQKIIDLLQEITQKLDKKL
ncbi:MULTISPECIES: hypothetical protein [Bacillaceae]|uniref:hypothetical protein n=1 Tax=Anoxybacillaceae TaxID=3120669 RepID=UPI0010FEB1B7|nr:MULTISPECIES: hypothetical protein [Bacillaceae]QNU23376.1 hypothetical protein IC806_09265 [Geobacillus zalihae]TLS33967.1 hypothetical protein FDK15_05110 [Geobacillus thermoleovorans]GLH64209.1 hypothetical protein PG301_20480 [Parageobacillus sp. G301]